MIKKIIKDDNYEIIIKNCFIHLINYISIDNISSYNIIIHIKNKKLIINGNDLIISALDECELIIKGNIKGIEFINE